MATGPNYRVASRRRREGKTDYRLRKALVMSGLPRLVIRGSLKNMIAQLIKAEVSGDKVIASAHSVELTKKYGWKGYCGNLPAAYLTGLLCGYRAISQGLKEAVLDIGLHHPSIGSRVFAALKGVVDAGVVVSHGEVMLPSKERLEGQHIVDYAKQLSSNPNVYQKRFSEQLSRGLRPEELRQHFTRIREEIVSSFKGAELPEAEKEKEET